MSIDVIPVEWDLLAELNTTTGHIPDKVQVLASHNIEIAGFIVPLEDGGSFETVREFLLVPDPMMCIHVPPPSPNQMIMVTMKQPIPIDMDYRGVAITGELILPDSTKEYGEAGYQLNGFKAKEANIEIEDPFSDLFEFY